MASLIYSNTNKFFFFGSRPQTVCHPRAFSTKGRVEMNTIPKSINNSLTDLPEDVQSQFGSHRTVGEKQDKLRMRKETEHTKSKCWS